MLEILSRKFVTLDHARKGSYFIPTSMLNKLFSGNMQNWAGIWLSETHILKFAIKFFVRFMWISRKSGLIERKIGNHFAQNNGGGISTVYETRHGSRTFGERSSFNKFSQEYGAICKVLQEFDACVWEAYSDYSFSEVNQYWITALFIISEFLLSVSSFIVLYGKWELYPFVIHFVLPLSNAN